MLQPPFFSPAVDPWCSCPPCLTFCLGWPKPSTPLKSFQFLARNYLSVWGKSPQYYDLHSQLSLPLLVHLVPPSPQKCARTSAQICSSRNNALAAVTLSVSGVFMAGWTQDVKLSSSDGSLDLDGLCCCLWPQSFPLVMGRGGACSATAIWLRENS